MRARALTSRAYIDNLVQEGRLHQREPWVGQLRAALREEQRGRFMAMENLGQQSTIAKLTVRWKPLQRAVFVDNERTLGTCKFLWNIPVFSLFWSHYRTLQVYTSEGEPVSPRPERLKALQGRCRPRAQRTRPRR